MSARSFFNIGSADRGVRVLLGLGLISMVFVGPQTPWGWLGLLPLVTAVVGWCPLYTVLGLSTRPKVTSK